MISKNLLLYLMENSYLHLILIIKFRMDKILQVFYFGIHKTVRLQRYTNSKHKSTLAVCAEHFTRQHRLSFNIQCIFHVYI